MFVLLQIILFKRQPKYHALGQIEHCPKSVKKDITVIYNKYILHTAAKLCIECQIEQRFLWFYNYIPWTTIRICIFNSLNAQSLYKEKDNKECYMTYIVYITTQSRPNDVVLVWIKMFTTI